MEIIQSKIEYHQKIEIQNEFLYPVYPFKYSHSSVHPFTSPFLIFFQKLILTHESRARFRLVNWQSSNHLCGLLCIQFQMKNQFNNDHWYLFCFKNKSFPIRYGYEWEFRVSKFKLLKKQWNNCFFNNSFLGR